MAASSAIQIEISQALTDFKFEESAMQALMHGPIARDLVRRAIRVEAQAKQYATGQNGGPNVRTGRLRGSITWRLGSDSTSIYVDIGSAVVYAPYVELGTSRAPAYPFLGPALDAARVD